MASFTVNTCLAALSSYSLYLSSRAIPKLQGYESMSEKAASYSSTAEEQLWRTKTTQASCVAALLTTLLTSLPTLFTTPSPTTRSTTALLNIAVLVAARWHIGAFWKGKIKVPVPGSGDYNDAIGLTQEVRLNMAYLVGGWVALGMLGLTGW